MTNTEPLEDIGEDDAEMIVVDPEEYHEAQRLREIHRARQKVTDTIHDTETWATDSDHARQQGSLAFAVGAYYAELEPLIMATDRGPIELSDGLPWDSAGEYATMMGSKGNERAAYEESIHVFRRLNSFLADVKPLIKPEESTEWEV